MKPLDYFKCVGVGFALLVVNILIAILVVTIYVLVIDPGHPREYYDEAALRIAPWCSHIAGTALFFITTWFLSVRRPDRSPYQFAIAVTLFYAIIDAATVNFAGIWEFEFATSILAKLAAALAGAFVGKRAAIKSFENLEN